MPLRFLAIDPGTNGDNCPAVFADEETGDLLFQGLAVTDTATLADAGAHSPLGDGEFVVRLRANAGRHHGGAQCPGRRRLPS